MDDANDHPDKKGSNDCLCGVRDTELGTRVYGGGKQ